MVRSSCCDRLPRRSLGRVCARLPAPFCATRYGHSLQRHASLLSCAARCALCAQWITLRQTLGVAGLLAHARAPAPTPTAEPQELQDQARAGQEAEAEPAAAAVDPDAHGQHHPLQRQAPPLAPHQAGHLSAQRARVGLALLAHERNLRYECSARSVVSLSLQTTAEPLFRLRRALVGGDNCA